MIKHFKRKTLVSAFALIMGAVILISPLVSYASTRPSSYNQKSQVVGDGVRHRRTPGLNGEVLGLMYYGEEIWLSAKTEPGYPAWCAVWRKKTGLTGWMEWSYFDHNYKP